MTEERLRLLHSVTDLTDQASRRDKNIDDIVLYKQMILKDLLTDGDIIEVLNNPVLLGVNAPPEDYYNVNIYSYLKIPDTQSTVKNFICFDIQDVDELYYSSTFLEKNIVFRTVSHESDVMTSYGVDRQDLLAMLVKDRYSWSNFMGMRLQRDYDIARVAENGYYYREMRFKITSPNAMNQKGSYIHRLDKNRGMYAP